MHALVRCHFRCRLFVSPKHLEVYSPSVLADFLFIQPARATVTTQQPQRFPQASVSVAGYSIDDVDGSLQKTEAMVGEVMGGWGGILKSTPPAKLLSRPPVR